MNQAPTIKKVRLPRSTRNDNIVGLMHQIHIFDRITIGDKTNDENYMFSYLRSIRVGDLNGTQI